MTRYSGCWYKVAIIFVSHERKMRHLPHLDKTPLYAKEGAIVAYYLTISSVNYTERKSKITFGVQINVKTELCHKNH